MCLVNTWQQEAHKMAVLFGSISSIFNSQAKQQNMNILTRYTQHSLNIGRSLCLEQTMIYGHLCILVSASTCLHFHLQDLHLSFPGSHIHHRQKQEAYVMSLC